MQRSSYQEDRRFKNGTPLLKQKKKIFGHRWLIRRLGLRKKKTYITSNNNKSSEKMRVTGIGKSIPAIAEC